MADLTTTITESVVLNGSVRGSTNTHTITDITNVAERIVECPGGIEEAGAETIIANWASVTNPATALYQNFDYNDSEYIRVTNLSDVTTIQVAFVSINQDSTCTIGKTADSCRFQLRPGETVMMWQTQSGKLGENTVPKWNAIPTNLSYIAVWNPTFGETSAPVNVELFTASKK